MNWVVKEKKSGRTFGSLDEAGGKYKELIMRLQNIIIELEKIEDVQEEINQNQIEIQNNFDEMGKLRLSMPFVIVAQANISIKGNLSVSLNFLTKLGDFFVIGGGVGFIVNNSIWDFNIGFLFGFYF